MASIQSQRVLLCRYGVGSRFKLKHTRAIVNAIHSGVLGNAEYQQTPIFDLHVSARLVLLTAAAAARHLCCWVPRDFWRRGATSSLPHLQPSCLGVLCGLGDPEVATGCVAMVHLGQMLTHALVLPEVSGMFMWCICW